MRVRALPGRIATTMLFAVAGVYLLAPLVVVIGGSFSGRETGQVVVSYVQFPPHRLSLEWYRAIPASTFAALGLSLALAGCAAAISCILGIPAALGLVRGRFSGRAIAAALFRAPLQIPAVVSGIAFLELFYAIDDRTGLQLAGSFAGMLVAHVFLAMPFVIGSVTAVLLRFNTRLEEAALSLGASRISVFRRVTLPVVMPGVVTGAIYGFLVSFIDVPVSLFLSRPGLTPYPVDLFNAMQQEFSPSLLASASLVILLSAGLLFLLHRIAGLDALLRSNF